MLRSTLVGCVLIAAFSRTVDAQTIYDDGGTHTISGSSGPIEVLGSTLNIVSPASVSATAPYTLAISGDSSSSISLSGGDVTSSWRAIDTSGSLTATGGSVTGTGFGLLTGGYGQVDISGGTFTGEPDAYPGGVIGGVGASIDQSGAQISGGVFEGISTGATVPGEGLDLTGGPGVNQISGGTFIGSGGGDSLLYDGQGNSVTVITGGQFEGPVGIALLDTAILQFTGTDLSFNGSQLTGTLADGDQINVLMNIDGSFSYSIATSGAEETLTFLGTPDPATPEPSSLLSLALGCGGVLLAGFIRNARARRRTTMRGD